MGFFATDILESATPSRTDPVRARQHPACGQKPLRGPIHNAISGYRFYNPELGRWINRDPVGEEGGLNLYGFVRNAGVLWADLQGLQIFYYVDREYLRDIAERNDGDRSDENLGHVVGMMGRSIGQHNERVARTGQEDLHLSGRIFNDLAQLRSFIEDVQGVGHHFIIHAHGRIDRDGETGVISRRIGMVLGGQLYQWGENDLNLLWRSFRGKCATLTLRVCGVSQPTAARIKDAAQAQAVYYDPGVNTMLAGIGQFGLDPVYEDDWIPVRYEYDPASMNSSLQKE